MSWRCAILLCLLLAPPDLDVAIPPGAPTSWGRRFPAITPRGGPIFPITPRDPLAGGSGKGTTVARMRNVEVDVDIASSFGVVGILTWDLTAHLPWVRGRPQELGPVTGLGKGPPMPKPGDALYWSSTAALLRLLLHPQLVSEKEVVAHLVEIGEPVLGVLEAASAERALEDVCARLARLIGTRSSAPRPLPGEGPRETMLKRFLAEELTSAHPYDPEGAFGRRIFAFAATFEPLLRDYTLHPDSFLRRNAVAALGRYRTLGAMDVLADVVLATDDAVVKMRALAALGSCRSLRNRAALVARLERTRDPIEQVALIQALGRADVREAVPLLLAIGEVARRNDPDTLQAVLSALAMLRHETGGVASFARSIAKSARANPEHFRVRPDHAGPTPDRVDAAEARAQVLEQLALMVRARLDPGDEEARERLLALVEAAPAPEVGGPAERLGGSQVLRRVHPPAQTLYLETLGDLAEEGTLRLRAVVADRTAEAALRGHALAQLPFADRGDTAADLVADPNESPEVKIYALEVMAADGHDKLEATARQLLAACGRQAPGGGTPEQRYLWLTALRALEARRLLATEDLLPLMSHPRAGKSAEVDPALLDRVERAVAALVAGAGARQPRARLRAQIDALLDLVIEHGLNRRITALARDKARTYVEGQLEGLSRRSDARYRDAVADAILEYLLGARRRTIQDKAEFRPVVLLEEEILLALGRTRTEPAAEALAAFLRDVPKSPWRAWAALALGVAGQARFADPLVLVLLDPDGFTRLCAYESLRHLTKQDYFADWLYGAERERFPAAEKYRAFTAGRR